MGGILSKHADIRKEQKLVTSLTGELTHTTEVNLPTHSKLLLSQDF